MPPPPPTSTRPDPPFPSTPLSRPPAPLSPARHETPGHDTEASLLYTSGTTGRPKGCILSNLCFLTAGAWYRDLGGVVAIREGQDRFYNPLPVFHMNHFAVTGTCRSEEQTSELQSLMRISYADFCLKKKTKIETINKTINN